MRMTIRQVLVMSLAITAAGSSAGADGPPRSLADVFDARFFSTASPKLDGAVQGGELKPAQFQAGQKGRLTSRTCGIEGKDDNPSASGKTCEVSVRYGGTATANNDCGVSTEDVTLLRRRFNALRWKLDPAPGSGNPKEPASKEWEFVETTTLVSREILRGIHFEDTQDDPDGLPGGNPVLEAPTLVDPAQFQWSVNRKWAKTPKAFYYAIVLRQWKNGAWKVCLPYDPMVVNRGN